MAPHLRDLGWHKITWSLDYGQDADWVLPNDEGGRLHAHEYVLSTGGSVFRVHLDRYDPTLGPVRALLHFFLEVVPLWWRHSLVARY